MSILDKMILQNVKCTICGAGYKQCDCWQECKCGHSHEKGQKCNNPKCSEFSGKKALPKAIAVGTLKF